MTLDKTSLEPISTHKPLPPLAKGLPLLGSSLPMLMNPLNYFMKMYQQYGSIFRFRLPGHEITVLTGIEANQLMATNHDYLASTEVFAGLMHEMGTQKLLIGMDGTAHIARRKLQRTSYSRENFFARLPQLITMIEAELQGWQVGQTIPVFRTLQRMVVHQLGNVLLNRAPTENFEDVHLFIRMNILVNVVNLLPAICLKYPAYVRAKQRLEQEMRDIIIEHRSRTDRVPDLVDALLLERDENGNPLTEAEMVAEMLGSYNAGMDTVAGTVSFMLFAILKSPELTAQIQLEADRLFADGQFNADVLKDMTYLHGAALETLRLYPVAPLLPRAAATTFEFAGYEVKAGSLLFVANGLTHFLPEYFPDPQRFDINRHTPEMRKTRPPLAYAPYSFGAHTCLGAGMAEAQVMVLIALLLHHFELALDPPEFTARLLFRPVPTPGNQLRVRIVRHRTHLST
jgi:cytochrome P450